jgi:hypothetical protein
MKALNQRLINLHKDFPLPERMTNLPISDDGYPVPWFVPYVDGKPEFRAMDPEKIGIAIRHKKCWLCGETLGKFMVFTIGPMCAVNRNSSEPPSHRDCAQYAVRACPFLSQPKMRRNEKDMPEGDVAGIGIPRNPGVTLLWTTLSYKVYRASGGPGILIRVGDPVKWEYFREGRYAYHDEILESMKTGLPILMKEAVKEGPEAVAELDQQYRNAIRMFT